MHTTTFIRRYIFRLPLGQLFTTREFLLYGSRASVDQALSRLVKKGIIVRLARGVFVREGSDLKRISVLALASVKAESFGKHIAAWGGHLAHKLGLITEQDHKEIFCVNGSTSSFKFGSVTIHFRKTCARKIRFGDNRAGTALRALWHLGRFQCSPSQVMMATLKCLRTDREEIRMSLSWLPEWLSSYFLPMSLPLAAFQN